MTVLTLPRMAGALTAAAVLIAAPAALAHAHLLNSTPAADAVVAAPKAITLNFSTVLEPKFSGVALAGANGAAAPVKVAASKDRKSLIATPQRALAAGVYKVTWHAVAKDGHRMQGDYAFTVR